MQVEIWNHEVFFNLGLRKWLVEFVAIQDREQFKLESSNWRALFKPHTGDAKAFKGGDRDEKIARKNAEEKNCEKIFPEFWMLSDHDYTRLDPAHKISLKKSTSHYMQIFAPKNEEKRNNLSKCENARGYKLGTVFSHVPQYYSHHASSQKAALTSE